MKKLCKFKFSVVTGVILFVTLVLLIKSNNNLNDYSLWNKITNGNSYQLWLSINTITSLIFSAMIPLTVMVITLETNTYINSINNIETKKINYRNMNKQNSEVILREIKQFYEMICYIDDLRIIESKLDIDIFESDYNELIREEVRFLNKLKEDFFYDDIILPLIIHCIENKHNVSKFVKCSVNLYNQFYGFDDQSMQQIDMNAIQEKALKNLYAKCFWKPLFEGQYARERTILYLKRNYILRTKNKADINAILENIKINKHNLECISILGSSDPESVRVMNSNEFIALAQVYNGKKVENVDEPTILNLLALYRDLYEQEGECNITCETIGDNNKEDVDYFIKNFKLDIITEDGQINYTIDNSMVHRYI